MASTYWFHGQLTPESLCRFRIGDAEAVNKRWAINVLGDAWAVKGVQLPESADSLALWRECVDVSQLVLSCYALRTGYALDLRIDRWVEARNTPPNTSIVHAVRWDTMVADKEATAQMTLAIWDAEQVLELGNPDWRFAHADLHTALRDEGDDWVLWAYRSIEDCARAVSDPGLRQWERLHAHLSVNEAEFKDRVKMLQVGRDAIGHGNRSDVGLAAASRERRPSRPGTEDRSRGGR